ncbi:MAG: hypothetical protein ACLP1Q_16010 [Solirubrobacteraceae bacterium]
MIVADSLAAVYTAPERPQNPEFLGVYGCVYRTKRSHFLESVPEATGTPVGGHGLRLATLAGTMVAYEVAGGGPGGSYAYVVVSDLATGKVVHREPTGTPAHPEPPRTENGLTVHRVGIGPATAIVVKSDGAVAWIVQTPREDGSYQVHAVDKTGSRLLASGPDIDPSSLALAGSTLYWTEDGKPMSATLS